MAFVAVPGAALRAAPPPPDREADLLHAIAIDDDRTVARLLADGVDPNVKDARGQVALYVALRDGSPKSARVLVAAKGLQVDAENAGGETPLMMAALRGNEEIALALLARGAAPHRPGWSPLHYAATGGSAALVRLFLSKGAPVDARSPTGRTPLMMAGRYGSSDAAEVLLEAGADRRLVDDAGLDAAANADAGGNDAVATWIREWHPKRVRPGDAR
jgi:ankyrin repeat protein